VGLPGGALGDLIGRAAARVAGGLSSRLTADLDDRDPDYIRENLSLVWLLSTIWFRARSATSATSRAGAGAACRQPLGGNLTPNTQIFNLGLLHLLRGRAPLFPACPQPRARLPVGQIVRKFGTVTASHENAHKRCEPVPHCWSTQAETGRSTGPPGRATRSTFAGRKGFIRLALDEGVQIVPVVSVGGQETALFLSRGNSIARGLGLDRLFRLKVLPISLRCPWGLNVGDFLGHFPLPAKITVEVLAPIDLREEFGPDPGPG